MNQRKKYKAAIVGCGRIASEFGHKSNGKIALSHAAAYTACPKTSLVAGCDSDQKKLAAFKKKWGVKAGYRDFKKMLKNEDIDILSVCTPVETHWPIVKYACQFPLKAVYCEKPIAGNVSDAKKMIKLCRKNNILLMVNHQRRFSPFYQELKKKISKNTLGRVQQVNCYYTRGILNTGIHILDLFCFLFGNVDSAMAVNSPNKSSLPGDRNLDAVLRFKNGLLATMKACDDEDYLILEIDILGSKGRVRLRNQMEYSQAKRMGNLLNKKQLTDSLQSPFKNTYGPISLTDGVKHVIGCIEKKEKPLSSGKDALQAVEIIETLRSSAENAKRSLLRVRNT